MTSTARPTMTKPALGKDPRATIPSNSNTSAQTYRGYQQSTKQLAAKTEAAVIAAYTASLGTATFVAVGAATVAAANVVAVVLADLALAAVLGTLPLGLARPDDDEERLLRSFSTLVERISAAEIARVRPEVPLAVQIPPERAAPVQERVARIARSEPLHAGRLAYHEAMAQRQVVGWKRQTDENPCELCASLADGTVLTTEVLIADHPNCSCIAVPITEEAA